MFALSAEPEFTYHYIYPFPNRAVVDGLTYDSQFKSCIMSQTMNSDIMDLSDHYLSVFVTTNGSQHSTYKCTII